MALNLPGFGGDFASRIPELRLPDFGSGSNIDKNQVIGKTLDIINTAVAGKYGMNSPTPQQAGDGAIYEAGKPAPVVANPGGGFWGNLGAGLGDAIKQGGAVYATAQANREANKNPPWNLYAMMLIGIGGAYLLLKK